MDHTVAAMAPSTYLSERRAKAMPRGPAQCVSLNAVHKPCQRAMHSSQDKESPPFSRAQIAVLFSRIEHDAMALAIELDELPVINPSCDASDNPSVHIENITT